MHTLMKEFTVSLLPNNRTMDFKNNKQREQWTFF